MRFPKNRPWTTTGEVSASTRHRQSRTPRIRSEANTPTPSRQNQSHAAAVDGHERERDRGDDEERRVDGRVPEDDVSRVGSG